MPTSPRRILSMAVAVAVVVAAASTPASATPAAGAAQADRAFPKRAVASVDQGVRRVAGLNVVLRRGVPTLRRVRSRLGAPETLVRRGRVCTARWDGGLELDFVTFGRPRPCARRPLQAATLLGRGWTVRVDNQRFRIGDPRSVIPDGARRVRRWGGGGYELASMRWDGTSARTTVLAHVGGGEIDRFYLWVGGAGD